MYWHLWVEYALKPSMRYFLVFCILILPSCGFSPVYGTLGKDKDFGQEDLLSYISIDNIPDRDGQFLRNALIDRFYRAGRPTNPQFKLSVEKIQESLRDLDITEDSDATRGQLRLDTTIILSDLQTGDVLLERRLNAITSYNILRSEFANRISEQNTRENALNNLADRIERQLVLYFQRENF